MKDAGTFDSAYFLDIISGLPEIHTVKNHIQFNDVNSCKFNSFFEIQKKKKKKKKLVK